MGFDLDSGYGPWRYQVFPSEEELREKLRLFANVETDSTARVTSVTFQPCLNEDHRSQDRRVVQSWNLRNGKWTFVGVFDGKLEKPAASRVAHNVSIFVGHAGHETVDYAMTELPHRIRSSLEVLLEEKAGSTSMPYSPEIVSSLLGDTITKFDKSLLEDLLSLFPGGLDGALTLPDFHIQEILNDADRGGQNLEKVRRCKRGSTALVSIVDPSGENLWVANLGDCEAGERIYFRVSVHHDRSPFLPLAVLGTKTPNGTWRATPLTVNHNGGNAAEVQRVQDEHPGEKECILRDRVLGAIAVTRGIFQQLLYRYS